MELHSLMAWKGPGAGWGVCTVEFTVQCSSSWNAVDIRSLKVTQAAGDTPEGCPTEQSGEASWRKQFVNELSEFTCQGLGGKSPKLQRMQKL